MQRILIKKIKFGSFFKLISLISLSAGITFGLTLFIIGLLGGNVNANLGEIQLTGIAGGVASLFIAPIIFLIFGIIISLLVFLPFKLLLMVIEGINLTGELELPSEESQLHI